MLNSSIMYFSSIITSCCSPHRDKFTIKITNVHHWQTPEEVDTQLNQGHTNWSWILQDRKLFLWYDCWECVLWNMIAGNVQWPLRWSSVIELLSYWIVLYSGIRLCLPWGHSWTLLIKNGWGHTNWFFVSQQTSSLDFYWDGAPVFKSRFKAGTSIPFPFPECLISKC